MEIILEPLEIILDGAGTNTRLCRGVLQVAFGVGRGDSHPPMQHPLKADEPSNGAASQVSASHYGYNVACHQWQTMHVCTYVRVRVRVRVRRPSAADIAVKVKYLTGYWYIHE